MYPSSALPTIKYGSAVCIRPERPSPTLFQPNRPACSTTTPHPPTGELTPEGDGAIDGAIDGTVDATIDATIDATVDATIDAIIDGAVAADVTAEVAAETAADVSWGEEAPASSEELLGEHERRHAHAEQSSSGCKHWMAVVVDSSRWQYWVVVGWQWDVEGVWKVWAHPSHRFGSRVKVPYAP